MTANSGADELGMHELSRATTFETKTTTAWQMAMVRVPT
jgi:hypothetical protein